MLVCPRPACSELCDDDSTHCVVCGAALFPTPVKRKRKSIAEIVAEDGQREEEG
jgi:hypothetical protein